MTAARVPLGPLPPGQGRAALEAEVRRVLAVLPEGAGAGLAVSGGADSVTMAHLVAAARADLGLRVLHVRHGLRDDAVDAGVAAATAEALGLPFDEERVEVPDDREGLEAAARTARLAALERMAVAHGLSAVLLAHTADDQAETVVLNLARGAGLAGLAGMPAVRALGAVTLVRPLLRARRASVRSVAVLEGWPWVEDPMNADLTRRRGRVRARTLPELGALSGGPGDPVGVLGRTADLLRDDAAALEQLAAAQVARTVVRWGPVRCVTTASLGALPPALARRVVRTLLAGVRGRLAGLPALAVEAVLGLAPGQAVDVPGGVRVTCGGGWLAAAPRDLEALDWQALPAQGVVRLPGLDIELCVEDVAAAPPDAASCGVDAVPDAVVPPLSGGAQGPRCVRLPAATAVTAGVRGWRPGDRLAGATRRATVADLLARAGVPRALRPLVPLVVDEHEGVLWVPGVALAATDAGGRGPHRRVWLRRALR